MDIRCVFIDSKLMLRELEERALRSKRRRGFDVMRDDESRGDSEVGALLSTSLDSECPLSQKQLHLLSVAVWYGTNTESLATKLGSSKHTVNNHFSRIIHVLKCASRANAVLIALRSGWISITGEMLLPGYQGRPEPPEEIK